MLFYFIWTSYNNMLSFIAKSINNISINILFTLLVCSVLILQQKIQEKK
jgi:hypothetical protein